MVKMRYVIQCLFFGAGIVFFGCATPQIQPPISGGDRDEHGCIPSAGYVWSELGEDCIRPFELDLQLLTSKTNDVSTYVQRVGVLFSSNRMQCEVFIEGKSPILDAVDSFRYYGTDKFTKYELQKIDNRWELRINNSALYVEELH
jgi:hypothetical protein